MNKINDISSKNLKMAWFGIFSAIIALLTFTPLGYIPLGAVSATTVHIPVIIASIVFGIYFGAGLGFVMGVLCILRAVTMASAPTDLFFMNPVVSVLPRICIGLVAASVFTLSKRILKSCKKRESIAVAISAALATLTNTVLVLFFLVLLYGEKISVSLSQALSFIIASIIAINGIVELVTAILISVPVCLALYKLKSF